MYLNSYVDSNRISIYIKGVSLSVLEAFSFGSSLNSYYITYSFKGFNLFVHNT